MLYSLMMNTSHTLSSSDSGSPCFPKKGKEGLTLIEVMIATFVFAIVMGAAIGCMLLAQNMGQSARNRLEAMHEGRAVLEELVNGNYNGDDLDAGSHSVSSGGFSGSYTVTVLTPGPIKKVNLSMNYPAFGRTATVKLETRISDALH